MWKWLHPYAKSETQYHLCGKFLPLTALLSALLLGVGVVWGLAFAPADYQQGNSFRIMYVHVPTAIWSMGVYGSMAIAAFICVSVANQTGALSHDSDGTDWCIVYFFSFGYWCCVG